MHPDTPSIVMSVFILITVVSGSEPYACESGQYYNPIDRKCEKCSMCPANQIIKHPCTKYTNTKCGPFNFNDFSENGDELPHHIPLNDFEEDSYYLLDSGSKSNMVSSLNEKSHRRGGGGSATVKEDQEYWRNLAFALIGLLSILIVIATVIILLTCRKLQRSAVIKQPEEGGLDDADSGYVVIRAIRMPGDTRGRGSDLSRDDYNAHPPLLGAAASHPDPHPAGIRGIPSRPRHLSFLPRTYRPRHQLLQCAAGDSFETDSVAGSCSDLKDKLGTVA